MVDASGSLIYVVDEVWFCCSGGFVFIVDDDNRNILFSSKRIYPSSIVFKVYDIDEMYKFRTSLRVSI